MINSNRNVCSSPIGTGAHEWPEYAWKTPKGEILRSYTMLTINADTHPLMNQFHKPADEKRMVVILQEGQYDDWLHTPMNQAREFLRPFPAESLGVI